MLDQLLVELLVERLEVRGGLGGHWALQLGDDVGLDTVRSLSTVFFLVQAVHQTGRVVGDHPVLAGAHPSSLAGRVHIELACCLAQESAAVAAREADLDWGVLPGHSRPHPRILNRRLVHLHLEVDEAGAFVWGQGKVLLRVVKLFDCVFGTCVADHTAG